MWAAWRKPCCSPGKRQVGVGDALGVEGGGHHLGLGRGHDLVLQALEEDHRAGQAVGVVDRRPLPVQGLGLRPGADQAVEVAGLELVGVAGQARPRRPRRSSWPRR